MDLILKADVDNLGYKDDLVTVKNGYGRNFLIPQCLRKNPSTLPSLVYIIAELTLARLGKWFVLVTSFSCKKYSSFGEEHKQRKNVHYSYLGVTAKRKIDR